MKVTASQTLSQAQLLDLSKSLAVDNNSNQNSADQDTSQEKQTLDVNPKINKITNVSIDSPGNGYDAALSTQSKQDLIEIITKTLNIDTIEIPLTLIWNDAVIALKGIDDKIAKISKQLYKLMNEKMDLNKRMILKKKSIEVLIEYTYDVLKDALANCLKNSIFKTAF